MNRVTAFAPATVANVGCGFDIFGFAIDAPGDEVEASFSDGEGVVISQISGDGGALPQDPQKNTASVAVLSFLKALDSSRGISLSITKKMPLKSGMGSSAASGAAAVTAVNALFDSPFSKHELLPFVLEGERIACGSAHADNAAPSLLGGFTIIRDLATLDIIELAVNLDLICVVVHPHYEVSTESARHCLSKEVPLSSLVSQSGNIAGVVTALTIGDYALLGRSLVDHIIEPQRSQLIPSFSLVQTAALNAGALGCSLSGSGPSLFALCETEAQGKQIGQVMRQQWEVVGISSDLYISGINPRGAEVIS